MMGPTNNKNKPSRIFSGAGRQVLIFLLAVLVTAGIYFWYHHHQQQTHLYRAPENNTAKFADQDLQDHNYKAYQLRLTGFAYDYIGTKKYDDARRVLSEIQTNVPSDKITSQTYRAYWYLYQQTGDTQNRKKYAELTAKKLIQEGQTKAAAAFEADANGK